MNKFARFAPHVTGARRTLKSQWPLRRQRGLFKLALRTGQHLWQSHPSSRAGQVCGTRCVRLCSASLGSHGAVPGWHEITLPSAPASAVELHVLPASWQEAWRTFLVLLGRAKCFKVFQNEPAAGCQMLFLICVIRTVVIYLQFGCISYGKSGEQLWSFPFKFFLCSVGDGRIDDQGASKRHNWPQALLLVFSPVGPFSFGCGGFS